MHSPESTKYFAKNLQFSTILRIFAARMDKSVLRDIQELLATTIVCLVLQGKNYLLLWS